MVLRRRDVIWRAANATEKRNVDHVSIGVTDLDRSAAFYDAVLAPLGYGRCLERARAVGYGQDRAKKPAFWLIAISKNQARAATPGLGLHFGFRARDRDAVRAFYEAAITHGARDNGAPGLRPEYEPDFYGAFVLDPDGFKIEAVCRKPE